MKKKVAGIFKVSLLVLVVGYYVSSTFFTHTHYFAGGIVTHSHPYLPSGHHSHTPSECQLIEHLTHFVFIGDFTPLILLFIPVFIYLFGIQKYAYIHETHTSSIWQRGPPVYQTA